MVRLLLPVILLLLGVGGGVGAGMFLGGGASDGPADEHATDDHGGDDEHASDDGHADDGHGSDDDHGSDDGHSDDGHGSDDTGNSATEYVRLNNQFVVPIVHHGSVRSLIVMALTLEVDTGENGAVFDREPRLRDAFLQVMFAHANAGGFDGNFTEAIAMAPLREALSESAHQILGELVHDVLIVDITRQDA